MGRGSLGRLTGAVATVVALVVSTLVVFGAGGVEASVFDMDPGFSGDGTVIVPTAYSTDRVEVGPMDTTVVAGEIGTDSVFFRYLADGSLDTTFSGDGMAVLPFVEDEYASDFVVQPDGKIVAILGFGAEAYKMVRLMPDGSLDASFGTAGVTELSRPPLTTGYYFIINGREQLRLAPDGSLYYVGTLSEGRPTSVIVKVTAEGVVDTSFGFLGYWDSGTEIFDYQIFPDSKLLVLQGTGNWGTGNGLVRRLMPNASEDASFVRSYLAAHRSAPLAIRKGDGATPGFAVITTDYPTDGRTKVKFFTNTGSPDPSRPPVLLPDYFYNSLVAGPNGKFYVGDGPQFRQLTAAGALSAAFGGDGVAEVVYGTANLNVTYWTVDSKGRVVALWRDPNTTGIGMSRIRHPASSPITAPLWSLWGQSRPGAGRVGDPVDTASGNLTDRHDDLRGTSFGLAVVRGYNGREAASLTLGPRWRVSVGSSIAADGDGVMVTVGDGTRFRFAPNGGGGWIRPGGFDADLVVDPAPPVGGGPLGMLRLVYQDGRVERFDTAGRLLAAIDWDGQTATSVYDAGGRLSTVTSSTGEMLTFTYLGSGLLSTVSLTGGRTVTYGYNAQGLLSQMTDEFGGVTTYGYTADGWLASIVDPTNRSVLANTYDSLGRVLTQTNASGGVMTFGYSDLDAVTFVTDSLTQTTLQYHHDPDGKVLYVSDPYGKTIGNVYDSQSNLVSTTDRLGVTATATFNANGKPLTVTESPWL